MDIGARNALDNNLNRRDTEIRRREGRVAGAFMFGLDDEANDSQPPVRRHRHIYEAQDMDQDEDGVVRNKTYTLSLPYSNMSFL